MDKAISSFTLTAMFSETISGWRMAELVVNRTPLPNGDVRVDYIDPGVNVGEDDPQVLASCIRSPDDKQVKQIIYPIISLH